MVYDELQQTDSDTSIVDVKSALWSLNALLQSELRTPDPEPLMKKPIFPISMPDGSTTLVNADSDFSIGDREYLTALSKGRAKLLDYELAEIRQPCTFLEWAKLSSRYLSKTVKEMTSVNGENMRAMNSTMRDLKFKTYAILR